jgi:BASS family bile acid:Na+ symporter
MQALDKAIAAVLIVTFMFQAGLTAPRRYFAGALARPRAVLVAISFMLVVEPVLAWLTIQAFHLRGPVAAAIAVLAVSGLLPLAARAVRAVRGDVALALVTTFVVGVLAIFTAPLTVAWLVGREGAITVEPGPLVRQLVILQGIPLAFGLLLRSSSWCTAKFPRIVRWINTAALVLVLLVVIVPRLPTMENIGALGALAGITFSVIAALVAYAFAGTSATEGRTLAVLANAPNVVLAMTIAASARAPRAVGVTILGMFLLRALVGAVLNRILARRAPPELPGEPHPAR